MNPHLLVMRAKMLELELQALRAASEASINRDTGDKFYLLLRLALAADSLAPVQG